MVEFALCSKGAGRPLEVLSGRMIDLINLKVTLGVLSKGGNRGTVIGYGDLLGERQWYLAWWVVLVEMVTNRGIHDIL